MLVRNRMHLGQHRTARLAVAAFTSFHQRKLTSSQSESLSYACLKEEWKRNWKALFSMKQGLSTCDGKNKALQFFSPFPFHLRGRRSVRCVIRPLRSRLKTLFFFSSGLFLIHVRKQQLFPHPACAHLRRKDSTCWLETVFRVLQKRTVRSERSRFTR